MCSGCSKICSAAQSLYLCDSKAASHSSVRTGMRHGSHHSCIIVAFQIAVRCCIIPRFMLKVSF